MQGRFQIRSFPHPFFRTLFLLFCLICQTKTTLNKISHAYSEPVSAWSPGPSPLSQTCWTTWAAWTGSRQRTHATWPRVRAWPTASRRTPTGRTTRTTGRWRREPWRGTSVKRRPWTPSLWESAVMRLPIPPCWNRASRGKEKLWHRWLPQHLNFVLATLKRQPRQI